MSNIEQILLKKNIHKVPLQIGQIFSFSLDVEEGIEGVYIPFTLFANVGLMLSLSKSQDTQDGSVWFWISNEPWGRYPNYIKPSNNNFSVQNGGSKYMISTVSWNQSQVDFFGIQIIPGDYFINFKNMVTNKNSVQILATNINLP